jgi:uncharacterized membrane protein AbrB (regulator of aidB expression)
MATREVTERDLGHRVEVTGDRVTGPHDETKWALLTTEFWAMVVGIAAILIAAAAADNFDAPRAWLLVAVVMTGYVVSRGIAKAGTGHVSGDGRDSRQGR